MDPNLFQQRARAFDYLFDAVVVTDMQGIVTDWNTGAERLYGYLRTEIIGKPVGILHAPEDVERVTAEVFASIERQGYWSGEIKKVSKDQSIGWIESFVIPLVDEQNQPIGALGINRDITHRREMQQELQAANESLKLQLEKIGILQEKLREQATLDPLTGLYNRRYLTDMIQRELARARREKTPVSVAILDLDDFKNINDTFGHKGGDAALTAMAELFLSHVRASDIVCRYGGEEFTILMPNASLNTAAERMEDLRKEVEAKPIIYNDKNIHITISIGVASFPDHGEDDDSILWAADNMLYQSKRNGRNQVSVAK
jgi:diguanylate cyclase (GGDEF)-like protein/PAS domain S-box-containing protein